VIKYPLIKTPTGIERIVLLTLLMLACSESSQTSESSTVSASDSANMHQHVTMTTQKTAEDSIDSPKRTGGEKQVESPNDDFSKNTAVSVQKIIIKSVEFQLIFDQELITVKAGTPVELEFINVDEMPHNLLIIKPGSLERIGEAADKMARDPEAAKIHFVPQTKDVLYSTPLLMIDERYTLRFTAPKEPGDYPYVCTYPGHWRTMKGIMRIVK